MIEQRTQYRLPEFYRPAGLQGTHVYLPECVPCTSGLVLRHGNKYAVQPEALSAAFQRSPHSQKHGEGVFVKAIDYKYAPKLVKLHKAHTDPEYFHRFLAAAGKIKQLYHPFIGELNDYTLLPSPDGEIFPTMIMPYYDGVSGNKIGYHLGPISPRKMAGAIHQVATGIDYLHAHNIVHCDIAPKNILFLTGSGTTPHALMIDFGVAYDCDEDAYLTPRENWGTAQYMAPEVFRHGLPTFASDQYSLGVTALEMMTQTTLSPLLNFEGLKIKDRLPRSISKVIGKATSINPQERFGTCTEFSEELYEAVNLHLQRGKDS